MANIAKFNIPMKQAPSKTHTPQAGTCIALSPAYRSETRNIDKITQKALHVKARHK